MNKGGASVFERAFWIAMGVTKLVYKITRDGAGNMIIVNLYRFKLLVFAPLCSFLGLLKRRGLRWYWLRERG
jgi:hypothetical protein